MPETQKMCTVDLVTPSKELAGVTLKLPALQPTSLELEYVTVGNEIEEVVEHRQHSLAISPVFLARVLHPKVLCQGDDAKTIIQISIDIKDSELQLQPGDTIGIIPQNSNDEVEQLLHLLEIDKISKDTVMLHIQKNSKKKNLPSHLRPISSLHNIFKNCVDIRAVPKKQFIRSLASFTSNETERRRLEELCSQQGGQDYSSLVVGGCLTISDLLKSFPSCRPPPSCLLEHLPPLQPRAYSVSTVNDNDIVNIVFSVLPHGLCTQWLINKTLPNPSIENKMALLNLGYQQQADVKIPVFIRKSNDFHMPDKCANPLIFIGAGTGISPFIGFLEKREKENETVKEDLGEIWLFFGCRYSTKDFIFKSELQKFVDNKTLSRLILSFSREETNGERPKYVQDSIKLYKEEFVEQLVDKNAILFLCGDVKNMAKDVINTIQMVIQEVKGIDKNESDSVMEHLKNSGRLRQDIWR